MGTVETRARAPLSQDVWWHREEDASPLFFRDPSLDRRLREVILPRLLEGRAQPLRIWVAGSGTGEEAYGLTITLLELLGADPLPFRVFASELDVRRVEFARAGAYDEAALRNVSARQRAAWFTSVAGRQRVSEQVRQHCIFAEHDLTRQPPFSRIDLALCCDVLPRMEPVQRERTLAALHYAVGPSGYLLLGQGEAPGAYFHELEGAPGVYTPSAIAQELWLMGGEVDAPSLPRLPSTTHLSRSFDRLLLRRFMPPALLVDEALTVLQTRGDVASVFGKDAGELMKLSALVGEGLAGPLARLANSAFRLDRTQRGGALSRARPDGGVSGFEVWAIPLDKSFDLSRSVALVFTPQREALVEPNAQARSADPALDELREHLAETAGAHAHAVEQLATLADELAHTNDELLASNEDLQNLNEELRSSQEQLKLSNEELNALNDELSCSNRALSQLHSDLINVFTTADMPLVILDAEGHIRRFSEQAHQLVNVRDSDLGRPFADLRLNVEAPDVRASLMQVLASEQPLEREVRDEGGRWHRLTIRPYRGPDDHIDGVLVSLIDIDALKQIARRAEQASEQAERANRIKDEFLATLSHELRSPLHGVLVYAQLVRRDALHGEKLAQAVAAIEGGVLQLVKLLDELLDVSRIVTGKFTLHVQPIELVDVVARALEAVAEKCVAKELRVSSELPGSLRVVGDAVRLQQVVANLLSNAIKFTPRGGSIAVSLERAGAVARLCVRDDGVGIHAEFLPRAFERFTQGDPSFTREFGGLGLGLHIVQQIVDMHGGQVMAESAGPGRGALFTVLLPHVDEPVREPLARAPSEPRLLDGLRILVVDDDRVARTAVSEALRHAGAEVLSAPSAADALEAVVECEPELLLCDIAMPGDDGYALIKRVRALEDPALAGIPALALTAFARASDRERALAAGYQDHLAKPVDVDLLTRALASLRAGSSAP